MEGSRPMSADATHPLPQTDDRANLPQTLLPSAPPSALGTDAPPKDQLALSATQPSGLDARADAAAIDLKQQS